MSWSIKELIYTDSNNNNNYKKDCVIDNWIENVCRLILLFLLFFLMCNFVLSTTKLHSNNSNNNKKITLHKCPDHLLTMSTWCSTALDHQMPLLGGTSDCLLSSQLHSSTCQGDLMKYCFWPLDSSTRGYICIWKFENTLCFMLWFTEVFSMKDQ